MSPTTTDSVAMVRYCRFRKASAPSWIASEMVRISGVPLSILRTQRARPRATRSARTLTTRTRPMIIGFRGQRVSDSDCQEPRKVAAGEPIHNVKVIRNRAGTGRPSTVWAGEKV